MSPGLPCKPLKLWLQPGGASEAEQRKGRNTREEVPWGSGRLGGEAPAARGKDSSRQCLQNSSLGKWDVGQNMNTTEKAGLHFGVRRRDGDRSHMGNRITTPHPGTILPSLIKPLQRASLPESGYPHGVGEETKTRHSTKIKNH